jgi:hypothetical protein
MVESIDTHAVVDGRAKALRYTVRLGRRLSAASNDL